MYDSDNIRYDLLRTGNVELTSNKILERGFLPAVRSFTNHACLCLTDALLQPPPAYYTVYPRNTETRPPQGVNTEKQTSPKPKETLITRYKLEERIVDPNISTSSSTATESERIWQDNAERREASLRERKARMVLAARE